MTQRFTLEEVRPSSSLALPAVSAFRPKKNGNDMLNPRSVFKKEEISLAVEVKLINFNFYFLDKLILQ